MNQPDRPVALDALDSTGIADRLARASGAILALRIALNARTPPPTEAEIEELKQQESHLDQMVAFFRAQGIHMLAQGAQEAVRNVNAAIDEATDIVADIEQTKAAIKAAAGLIDLAGAILSRNPLAVADAVKALRQPAAVPSVGLAADR